MTHALSYDLHIHSCLSPCADDDMTPCDIAGMAHVKGLDIIALTDHNTCRNARAVMEAALPFGITVLPGMELTTSEEVHVLFLFAYLADAMRFDSYVYERLIKVVNNPAYFGRQLLMNEKDVVTGEEEMLLSNATTISFDDCTRLAKEFGGIAVPAHLEKETTSLLSNLGTIPPDADFVCAEINHPDRIDALKKAHPYLEKVRILTDSDAHMLGNIAEPDHTLVFPNEHPAPEEILMLLQSPL
ncbi:MAG: PHP domain-containing protein [Lachnospiraceae bacterium]|nr:PHP domain-containing protein [Lachnospiraceae bacterium]